MTSLVSRAKKCLSNVLSHATELEIERGEGTYLIDRYQQRYLDLGAGIAVNSTGHCHPDVVHAIQAQSTQLLHACAGVVYYEQNIALAEQLCEASGLNAVFFTQSGAEAVEAALKCAIHVTKKQRVIAFKGSFHGRTLGALSVTTSNKKYTEGYPLAISDPIIIDYPNFTQNPAPTDTYEGYVSYLNNQLSEQDPSHIGALIIEPFLGEGGYIPAPDGVLKILRSWCTKNNVMLIFDEIQSGMGRTGTWFYYQHANVMPDILTSAKGIASGLPLGACISTQTIMDQWTTGSHGGTYSGNPLSCAAGIATMNVIQKQLPQVQVLGDFSLCYLKEKLADCDIIRDIRGKGLMIGIEFITPDGEPHSHALTAIKDHCLKHRVLVVGCGQYNNVLRLMPPLTISKEDLTQGLDTVINACQSV
ncbi:MAG: aspartate aminotransferase family protein [Candidatus Marinamargulisbacteria bacterium]